MRTRDNSIIISLRVEKELHKEFALLSNELGELTPRKLREAYLDKLKDMRERVNARRLTNGLPSWEEEFGTQEIHV
jgi:hypothetical protein